MIRILIADDQAVVRAGLSVILGAEVDFEVVAEAADGAEAARRMACTATAIGSNIAAASKETSSGNGIRFQAGTDTYSAKAPFRLEPV